MVSVLRKDKISICKMVLGSVRTNTYLVYNEDGEGIIIDPADSADIIKTEITNLSIKIKGIVLTHGHFDHIGAALELRSHYNVKIYAHEKEEVILESSANNLSFMSGGNFTIKADIYLKDNEKFKLAGFDIQVIHTPGHTIGSVCYLISKDDERVLMSGDTLFLGSHGRFDFPTGSYPMIMNSIKEKLLKLDEDLEVYPGHNEQTTIGKEKSNY